MYVHRSRDVYKRQPQGSGAGQSGDADDSDDEPQGSGAGQSGDDDDSDDDPKGSDAGQSGTGHGVPKLLDPDVIRKLLEMSEDDLPDDVGKAFAKALDQASNKALSQGAQLFVLPGLMKAEACLLYTSRCV